MTQAVPRELLLRGGGGAWARRRCVAAPAGADREAGREGSRDAMDAEAAPDPPPQQQQPGVPPAAASEELEIPREAGGDALQEEPVVLPGAPLEAQGRLTSSAQPAAAARAAPASAGEQGAQAQQAEQQQQQGEEEEVPASSSPRRSVLATATARISQPAEGGATVAAAAPTVVELQGPGSAGATLGVQSEPEEPVQVRHGCVQQSGPSHLGVWL